MSYDLDVRPAASHQSLPFQEVASVVEAMPGFVQAGPATFVLDRRESGVHLTIDLCAEGEDEAIGQAPAQINVVSLTIPYPFLDKTHQVGVTIAFELADTFGWEVHDCQSDQTLTKDTAFKAVEGAREAAAAVLAKVDTTEKTLGELFRQEMWNHSLPAAAFLLLSVAGGSVWLMIRWGWSEEDFGRYLPWIVAVGGVAALYAKGLIQALFRRSRRHKRS
jgi:hypothetical protein